VDAGRGLDTHELQRLSKIAKALNQGTWCPGRNLTRATPKHKYSRLSNLARWRHLSTKQHTMTIKLKGDNVTWQAQGGQNVSYGAFVGQRNPTAELRILGRPAVTAGTSFYPMHLFSKENSMHYNYKFNQALQNVFRISIHEMTERNVHAFLGHYDLR